MYLWLMLGWGQHTIASHNYMNVPVWLRELFKRECIMVISFHNGHVYIVGAERQKGCG